MLVRACKATLDFRDKRTSRHFSKTVNVVLAREERSIRVLDHDVRLKVSTLPNGERRVKPELEDLKKLALESGRPVAELAALALTLSERE